MNEPADEADPALEEIDAVLASANVLLRVAAQSVLDVEEIVTTPQLRVLILIAANGPQNLGGVAVELGVHPSNATRTCDRLVQAGLIARTEHRADRRYLHLALTDRGRDLVSHVLERRRRAIAEILSRMPADQRAATARALSEFATAAGGEGTRDGRFALSLPK
ncbi:MarR family transcriptional regulator [Lacisediminihabitans sp.]|uniref:MarR family transcriptional regulator n=1 Tax=Lacisediminihabitans sp. TaxID=2787631 RepID=UPI00374DA9AE